MSPQRFIQTVILAGLLAACLPGHADAPATQTDEDKKVYRKFHPDGVVEFSDQPSKGSEELTVETLPTYKFTPPPAIKPYTQTRPTHPTGKHRPYTALVINNPKQNGTIRANNGEINVTFSLTPNLRTGEGDQIEYLLDGKTILKSQQPQTLKNIARGTHTLVIRITDKNNKVLIHSDPVSFSVMRYFKPPPHPAP